MSINSTIRQQALLKRSDCAIGVVPIAAGTPLKTPSRGFYVGGAGNATVTFADGSTATLTGLLPGILYPFSVINVSASGLTASNLVATY